ncbi:hypothetical protein [Streptomyces sp. URMC 123]|uniref:hypothetical protein n=1 Tax=Streptomyces sp. URMC 123 TaxID=3423403 RepID=UPI003F1B567B
MATRTATTGVDGTAQEEHRFAELAARTGLEPELAQRYADDPVGVLAEFGLPAAESAYHGGSAMEDHVAILAEFGLSAAEPLFMGAGVVIEELDDRLAAERACPCMGTRHTSSAEYEMPAETAAR